MPRINMENPNTKCFDCGLPLDCLDILRCRACIQMEGITYDTYDPDEDSRWSPDGRGHTQVSLGTLEPEEMEFDANG